MYCSLCIILRGLDLRRARRAIVHPCCADENKASVLGNALRHVNNSGYLPLDLAIEAEHSALNSARPAGATAH